MAAVSVDVVPCFEEWPAQFALVENELSRVLQRVPVLSIEHVGSTSVPGGDDVLALADDVIVLENGSVVQRGSPDDLSRAPATPYVRRLMA